MTGEERRLADTTQFITFKLKYRTKSTCGPCRGLNDVLEELGEEAVEVRCAGVELFNKAEVGL